MDAGTERSAAADRSQRGRRALRERGPVQHRPGAAHLAPGDAAGRQLSQLRLPAVLDECAPERGGPGEGLSRGAVAERMPWTRFRKGNLRKGEPCTRSARTFRTALTQRWRVTKPVWAWR